MRDVLLFRFAVTNAPFAPLHGLLVVPVPLQPHPFHYENRALVTSGNQNWPNNRLASVCGSAAGVALRLRFTMRFSPPPLHFSRSPTADRSRIVYFPRAIRRDSA
jgi:hypothetical protein